MTVNHATTNNLASPWVKGQSLLGFIICMGSLASAVYMAHIPWQVLIQPTALLLVGGGTLGALCLSNPLPTVFSAFWKSIFPPMDESVSAEGLEDLVADFIDIASFARREGLLALTPHLAPLAASEPFLYECLQRLSNNKTTAQLEADLGLLYQQGCHALTQRIAILEQAAGYLPTMGLMGALLGILQVFSQPTATTADTTAQLGQMLPFASELTASFSATLLGIGLANWCCLPLAQLQQKSLVQLQQKYALIIEGVLAIHRNEHPLQLQETLKLYLQGALIQAGGVMSEADDEPQQETPPQRKPVSTGGISAPSKPKNAQGVVSNLAGQPPFLAASTANTGSHSGLR